jgi:hypothetical protein
MYSTTIIKAQPTTEVYVDPIWGTKVDTSGQPTLDTSVVPAQTSFEDKAFKQVNLEERIRQAMQFQSRKLSASELTQFMKALTLGYDEQTGETFYNHEKAALGIFVVANFLTFKMTPPKEAQDAANLMLELPVAHRSEFENCFGKYRDLFKSLPILQNDTGVVAVHAQDCKHCAYQHPMLLLGLIPQKR